MAEQDYSQENGVLEFDEVRDGRLCHIDSHANGSVFIVYVDREPLRLRPTKAFPEGRIRHFSSLRGAKHAMRHQLERIDLVEEARALLMRFDVIDLLQEDNLDGRWARDGLENFVKHIGQLIDKHEAKKEARAK